MFWLEFTLSFQKKRPRPNLKGFHYQILISVKSLGKQLSSKKNFSAFLQISCFSFRLNCVQGLRVTKIVKKIKFKGVRGELESGNCFRGQSFWVSGTGSGFRVGWRTAGGGSISVFWVSLPVLGNFYFWRGTERQAQSCEVLRFSWGFLNSS